jgi:dUTP pyrophosphatase
MQVPQYATDHSAGMDLCAAVDGECILKAGETALIPTGFAIALPEGFEAQVRPRSGLAAKNQVTVLNSPGTIDADYRGEVKVILTNFGKQDFVIKRGDRIAQMVVAPYTRVQWEEKESLDETKRGVGGFGHTGR